MRRRLAALTLVAAALLLALLGVPPCLVGVGAVVVMNVHRLPGFDPPGVGGDPIFYDHSFGIGDETVSPGRVLLLTLGGGGSLIVAGGGLVWLGISLWRRGGDRRDPRPPL